MPVPRKRLQRTGRGGGVGTMVGEASLIQEAQKGAGGSGDGAHGAPRWVRN